MAGAPDPGIAAALEAQSKSLDAQSRTLATQSKLLQQLCDRLESQDHRWSNLEKVVSANADNIAVLQAKLEDGGD
jgi:septal ring factor EnvC (AmiA/AmiB activator)